MGSDRLVIRKVSAEAAADLLYGKIEDCLRRQSACALILAGGETPKPVYERLGGLLRAGRVDPASLFFFLGDERHAERGSSDRNETMIRSSLFRSWPPRQENVHFWEAFPRTPHECAAVYESVIEGFFIRPGRAPDLAVLGLGADGHTASLFPGVEVGLEDGRSRPLLADEPGNALAVHVPEKRLWRLSLSARFLRTSREIVFLVGGKGKAKAMKKLASGDRSIPASWVSHDRTTVLRIEETDEDG